MKKALCLLLTILCVYPVFAEDGAPAVFPYRPTVSNPAGLSAPGWLELETGWLHSQSNDDTLRGSLLYTLKLAFTDSFGVLLGGEGVVDQTDAAGTRTSGGGDTSLLLKHKFNVGEQGAAFGLEYGQIAPATTRALTAGSGTTDYLVNGIYSHYIAGHSIDLNLNYTALGEAQADQARQQWGWAATVTRVINDRWGASVELSGVARTGTQPSDQLLVAMSYQNDRRVSWDAGVSVGLNTPAPKHAVFAGVSVLLGKVF